MTEVFDLDAHRIELERRNEKRGFFALQSLEQRGAVASIATGTGWWELDQIWKLYPGQFTILTGMPGHGKSTFALNVVVNVARLHGMKSFLYVPENESHLRNKLARIWSDKPGFETFCAEQCFVQSSMPEHYDDPVQDLKWVLNRASRAVREHSIDLLLIDPWNELEFAKDPKMPMTDYIRDCLKYLKQFCRSEKVAVILVAHPTKAVTENGGRTPLLSDVEGSMSWYNKCDNGLIVVRDFKAKDTRVISAKVREIGAGKIGACHFLVDPETEVFTPQYGAVS